MKRLLASLLVFILLCLPLAAVASEEEKILNAEQIQIQPINVFEYVDNQVDYLSEIIARLWDTGRPTLLFHKESKGGAGVTLIEDFLNKPNLNLTGGITIEKDNPSQFFIGVDYELSLVGGMWEIFERFQPAVFYCKDRFYWGFTFELRLKE